MNVVAYLNVMSFSIWTRYVVPRILLYKALREAVILSDRFLRTILGSNFVVEVDLLHWSSSYSICLSDQICDQQSQKRAATGGQKTAA